MSKRVQLRRGTATQHNTFTGSDGEVTVDTTNKTLKVHDGTTVGGTALAKVSQLPASASATTQGLIEIATQTEVNAGTDSTRAIVPNTLLGGMRTHLNASGTAPMYACRAWVCFNGESATITPLAGGNVQSIVDNGTGNYTINFINPMVDANYLVMGAADRDSTSTGAFVTIDTMSTSSVTILSRVGNGGNTDSSFVSVGVVR